MRDYKITHDEYIDYLIELRNSVFKILPLYEDENEFLTENMNDLIEEVICVKEILHELPCGYWYVKTLINLELLLSKINDTNHKYVKRKILNTTNLIQKEVYEARGEYE